MRRHASRRHLSIDTNCNDPHPVPQRRSFRRRFSSEDSIALESFSIKTLRHESPFKVQLEQLINFISSKVVDLSRCGESLRNLEHIVVRTLSEQHEPSLLRLLKGFGWTGQSFGCTEESPLDTTILLQALSNLYLKFRNIQSSILPADNEQQGALTAGAMASPDLIGGVEQVLPFCPDILFDFLAQNPEVQSPEDIPCLSFTGACMLVDISGFSKFSGSMCSKGVTGLDELRQATNGFLGHFVKTVYEYNGDVVAFAGDALLCVFVDKHSAYSSQTERSANGSFHSGYGQRDSRGLKRGGSFFNAAMNLQSASADDDAPLRSASPALGPSAGIGSQSHSNKNAAAAVAVDSSVMPLPSVTRNCSNKSDFGTCSHFSELSVSSSNSCYRALRCASILRNHQTGSLSTHIGVSYGNMKMALLGGYKGQWVYLMNGSCVSELSSCIEDAKAQQVVATEDCYARALEVYLVASQPPLVKSPATTMAAAAMLSPTSAQTQQPPLSLAPPTPTPTPNGRLTGFLPPKAPVRQTSSMLPGKDGIGAWSSNSSSNDARMHQPHIRNEHEEYERMTVQFDDIEGLIAVEETDEDEIIASMSADSELPLKGRSVRFIAASSDSGDLDAPSPLPHQQHIQCRRPNRLSANVLVDSMGSVPRMDSQGNLFAGGDTSPNELGRVGFIQRMSGMLESTIVQAAQQQHQHQQQHQQQQQRFRNSLDEDDREIAEEEERLVGLTEQQMRNRSAGSRNPTTAASTSVGDDNSVKHLSQREHLTHLAIQRHEQIRKYISIRSVESYNSSTHDSSEMDREADSAQKAQQALLENVAMFVPIPVLASLRYEALDHIGELRTVTTMFLSLDSYSPTLHSDPTTLQPFFLLAQEAMFNAGGFLRQFLVDDKGCVLIAMWGVPSFTYANNCSRALHCAVQILLQSAEKLELQCSIGITTGNVFCGSVGCAERRDYAGIGTDVNMAARLMAKAHGRVLIDHRTFNNLPTDSRNMLRPAEAMMLKGNIDLVTPYEFTGSDVPPMASLDENVAGSGNSKLLKKNITQLLCAQLDRISNNMAASIREARMLSPLGRHDFSDMSPMVRGRSMERSPSLAVTMQHLQQQQGAPTVGAGGRPLSLPWSPRSSAHSGLHALTGASPQLPMQLERSSSMPISLPRTPGGIARAVDSAASLSGLLYRNGSRNNLMSPRELRVLGTVHITVLQGPAGTGKSTAAEYFRMEARKRGLHVVYIKAESTHRAEPYGVVRDIFFEIVGLPRPSSLNAENCSPDFLARMGAPVPESKKLKGGRTKASVLETVRATLTDQVRSLVKTLVSSAYELCSQKEIDDAIESVRNVLGLQPAPRSEGENATASSATKSNGETQSGKSTNEGNGSSVFGPFSTGKPTRTGSLLSTKGMSFSFGSTKSSLRRMGSSDNSAASRSGFDLDQADFTFQQGAASSRTAGDLAFYKVLATLLRNTPTALVIENAQNCDELSWQELLIILMGFDLEMAVLVTIRNNFLLNTSDSNIDGAPATAEKAAAGGVDSKEGNGPDSPLRMPVGSFRSVPKLSRVSSQVDDFNASFIVSMPPETSARGINFEDGRFEASEAYQAICSHSNCTVKTMTGLKEDGVRHYLVHTLKVENISKDLVKTVYRISGGNFDWNRSVVMFIKERGVETFEEAIKDEATNESALRALIIYRISDLTPTARMVLRYASIVGHEFSERLLSSIVPHGTPRNSSSAAQQSEMRVPNSRRASVNASGAGRSEKSSTRGSSFSGARADRLRKARTVSGKIIVSSLGRSFKGRSGDGSSPMSAPQIISPALDTLTKLGFFNCIRESPVPLYEFQNEFVHATVYEMIPPSDAALIHTAIAHYLESTYADNLVPFYPRLGFHYKHGTNGRKDAFKYELKAASHCVSRGAFSDALIFINSAADLAEDTREYKLLLHVINYGLKTLGVRQGPFSSLYSLLSRALTKHNQFLDSEDFYLSESNSAFVDVETMMQSTAPPPTYSSVPRGTPVSRGIAEHRNGNNVSGGARTVDAYKRVKAKVERLLSNCIKDKNSSTNSISGPVSAPGRGSCFSPRLFRGDDFTSSGDSQRGWSSNLRSKSRSKKATGRPELGLTPEAIVEGEEDHAGGASAATVTTKTTSSTSATGTGGGPAAEATASEVQTPQKGAAMAAERDGSPVLDDHREVASQFSVSSTGSNDAIPLPPLTPRESADGCGLRCSCVVS